MSLSNQFIKSFALRKQYYNKTAYRRYRNLHFLFIVFIVFVRFRQFHPKRNHIIIDFDAIGSSVQRECDGGCTPAVNGGSTETQNTNNWELQVLKVLNWNAGLLKDFRDFKWTEIPNVTELSYWNVMTGEYWNTVPKMFKHWNPNAI